MFFNDELSDVKVLPGRHEPDNHEERVLAVPVFDASESMEEHYPAFPTLWSKMVQELVKKSIQRLRIELACCAFHSDVMFQDYAPLPFYLEKPLAVEGTGVTALGTALQTVIKHTRKRRRELVEYGIECRRAICPVITDGQATDVDVLEAVIPEIRRAEAERLIDFVLLAPDMASIPTLRRIFDKEPILLDGVRFDILFRGLAGSLSQVSERSRGHDADGRQIFEAEFKRLPDLR